MPSPANESHQRRPGPPPAAAWPLLLALALSLPGAAAAAEKSAEDPAEPAAEATTVAASAGAQPSSLFERVLVVGSTDRRAGAPGSVTYLEQAELARQGYDDVHRTLSMVPGVNVQEEDGYGLRPNIGFRGSGAERSSKITLMEDGLLIAPAPYAAPSAYYFPTIARMDGIEIRKGSSSIRQGPFTTGGVLNLVSAAIPSEFGGDVRLAFGTDETARGRARIGGSTERFGWLVETYRFETDGFKRLDGGGPTGVELGDYHAKLRFTSRADARAFQAVELKLGHTDQSGHETYLGLTQADFAVDPYRRYASSQEDVIDTDHDQVHVRYFLRPGERFDLTATAYRNEFSRNWRKLGRVDAGAGFVGISTVLDDAATYASELAILRGDVDSGPDALNVRNNRRDYYAQGVHALLGFHPAGGRGAAKHEIEVGVRVHEDEEDRYQEEDLFRISAGRMERTTAGVPGSQANRIHRAEAVALHVQDTITTGRWTVAPGVRYEWIEFERLDYGKSDPARIGTALERTTNSVSEMIPGVGVTLALDGEARLFFGVHRGFAPPGPGANALTEPEESVNYEVGYRRAGKLGTEVVVFLNDYDNLLGADTLSSGGTGSGDLFNGGEAETRGVEASASYEFGGKTASATRIPVSVTYTFTQAEFHNTFDSEYEAWGSVRAGDELPYVPEHRAAAGAGLVRPRWNAFVNVIYEDRMRTVAGQGPIRQEESTDSHVLVDLSADCRLKRGLGLFVQVRNATDRDYAAARRPAGVRPGLPRTVLGGVSFEF